MVEVQKRYSKITEKFPRELILLQGKGCFWKKCAFCDYYEDVSCDSLKINIETIDKVTGSTGVLDVINSGSAMELDEETLDMLIKKVTQKNIKELWFEVHWAYRNKLEDFAKKFKNCRVNFRTGIETFNPKLRTFWNKGVPEDVTPEMVAKHFRSVSLLVGTQNQSFESVVSDIKIADKYFEHFMVNVFIPCGKPLKSDPTLIRRFTNEVYPEIKDNPKAEISIHNTDLGVG